MNCQELDYIDIVNKCNELSYGEVTNLDYYRFKGDQL